MRPIADDLFHSTTVHDQLESIESSRGDVIVC